MKSKTESGMKPLNYDKNTMNRSVNTPTPTINKNHKNMKYFFSSSINKNLGASANFTNYGQDTPRMNIAMASMP